ncbi:MAG TPA: hypothetical protein VHR97_01730 [Candidatus Baltobacteraceae bacterium]|jgi:phage gpG-like protein|nr:hypothetical protein [Candidatus Baltobacteraceae bacterium]
MIGGSSNADELVAKLDAQIKRLSNFEVPLARSGDYVRSASVMRIKQQGGDIVWIPNKRGGHTGIDTGRMMGSIQVSPVANNSVSVGTDVPYARWFQEGTGIYAGHTPWTIVPTNGKALKFVSGGVTYLRRKVIMPGQPGRVFLTITDRDRQNLLEIWRQWVMGVAA